MKRANTRRRILVPLLAAVAAAAAAAAALAQTATAPENVVPPTLSGVAKEGSTLTASRGLWANGPTSFVFKWQRCDTDGTGCSKDLQTGGKNTYTVTAGDVQHTVRVVVTGVNADGRGDTVPSDASDVVSSKSGPKNTSAPSISGQAKVGEQLTVAPGSWTPTASYSYQWQRCDTDHANCLNIVGAKATTYEVQAADVGSKLRVLVTAKTSAGQTNVYTGSTEYVQSDAAPPAVNRAPTLQFLSLIATGRRVYARFRVCDDGLGRITVVERDTKAGAPAYTRRYSVSTYASCGTFTRSWVPAPRFRTRGRFAVTLQAVDKSQKLSARHTKSLYRSR